MKKRILKKILGIGLFISVILILCICSSKTKAELIEGYPVMTYADYNYIVNIEEIDFITDQENYASGQSILKIINNKLIQDNSLTLENWQNTSGDQINTGIYLLKLDIQGNLILKAEPLNTYYNTMINNQSEFYYQNGYDTGTSTNASRAYEAGYIKGSQEYAEEYQLAIENLEQQHQEELQTARDESYQLGIEYAQSHTINQPQLYDMLKQVALYPVLIFTQGLDIDIFGINIGGLLLGIFMIALMIIIIRLVIGIIKGI